MDQADVVLYAPPEDLHADEYRENARRRKQQRGLMQPHEVYEHYLVKTALVRSATYKDKTKRLKFERLVDVFPLLEHLRDAAEEHSVSLFFDLRLMLVAIHELGKGDRRMTPSSPEVVVKVALLSGADHVIVAHNHPSGDPEPSPADRSVRSQTIAQCECQRINLIDALVVAEAGVASLEHNVYLNWDGKVTGNIGSSHRLRGGRGRRR